MVREPDLSEKKKKKKKKKIRSIETMDSFQIVSVQRHIKLNW